MNILLLILYILVIISVCFLVIFIFTIIKNNIQKKLILKELIKIKETYITQKEYKYLFVKGKSDLFAVIGCLILFDLFMLLKWDFRFNIIGFPLLFLIIINVIWFYLSFHIYKYGIQQLQIKDELLIIKYSETNKKYEIKNIDKLNLKVLHGKKYFSIYLYIKNKNENVYDEYYLGVCSESRIIAIIIFIELIKQNNLEIIDSISTDEIERIKSDIKNIKTKDIEIHHIPL